MEYNQLPSSIFVHRRSGSHPDPGARDRRLRPGPVEAQAAHAGKKGRHKLGAEEDARIGSWGEQTFKRIKQKKQKLGFYSWNPETFVNECSNL